MAPTHAGVAFGAYQQSTDASLNTRVGATLPTASAVGYSGPAGRNPWSRLVGGTTLNNCQSGKAAAY